MSSLGDLLNDWDDKAQGVRREINKMLTNKIALDGKQVLCTQKWEKKGGEMTKISRWDLHELTFIFSVIQGNQLR